MNTIFRHGCAIVTAIVAIVACSRTIDPSDSNTYTADPAHCRVEPEAANLQSGLCSADTADFGNEIRRMWESNVPGRRELAVRTLERTWRLDSTLGEGLPLKALDSPDFRTVVVEFLAQAVRSGLSEQSLAELQDFAASYSNSHRNDDRTAGAARISGFTDASSQLQFLISTIRTNAGHARPTAIIALGNMCSEAANQVLHDIQKPDASYTDVDRRAIRVALALQTSGPPMAWCKNPRHGAQNAPREDR
jgi:hypothetical protein